jgi:hypothetical protein
MFLLGTWAVVSKPYFIKEDRIASSLYVISSVMNFEQIGEFE